MQIAPEQHRNLVAQEQLDAVQSAQNHLEIFFGIVLPALSLTLLQLHLAGLIAQLALAGGENHRQQENRPPQQILKYP